MIEVICLFFPAFLSFDYKDSDLSLFFKIKKYVKYNILSNLIVMIIIYLKSDYRNLVFDDMFTISVAPKYLLLASLIAYFLPKVLIIIHNNFKIEFKLKELKNVKSKKNH